LIDSLGISKVSDGEQIDSHHFASHFHEYSMDLIRRLNKNTLHEILCSKSLKVLSEDDLLKTLIELGPEYSEYLCYIEVSFLSSTGISQFVEHLEFDNVTESIRIQIVDRLKHSSIIELPSKSTSICDRYLKTVGFESKILKSFPTILKEFAVQPWKLLYRGSRDGFKSSDFHSKCDHERNTLTLIETTKDFIFGGFTPIAWESSTSGISKPDSSGKSFLFSLKNPRNSEPRKFNLMSGKNAIYCSSSRGPAFAGNCDLGVTDNCNTSTNNWTSLGGSYVNDTGVGATLVFTGEPGFTVKEI
jgi:hypothetical protein